MRAAANSDTQQRLQKLVDSRVIREPDQQRLSRLVRQQVLQNSEHICRPNFKTISAQDLGLIFVAIDEFYFDGLLGKVCESASSKPLAFRLSTRMTSAGGMTTMRSGGRNDFEYEIAIATTPLFQTFQLNSGATVGGLQCQDRLDAIQRIMEHEMIHLTELLLTGDSSCARRPFRRIVRQFFGHLASNHQLLTPTDFARRQLNIRPGDRVLFQVGRKSLMGFVNRISKRATVLVRSSTGTRYDDGQKYDKYYVPLHRLKKAS